MGSELELELELNTIYIRLFGNGRLAFRIGPLQSAAFFVLKNGEEEYLRHEMKICESPRYGI